MILFRTFLELVFRYAPWLLETSENRVLFTVVFIFGKNQKAQTWIIRWMVQFCDLFVSSKRGKWLGHYVLEPWWMSQLFGHHITCRHVYVTILVHRLTMFARFEVNAFVSEKISMQNFWFVIVTFALFLVLVNFLIFMLWRFIFIFTSSPIITLSKLPKKTRNVKMLLLLLISQNFRNHVRKNFSHFRILGQDLSYLFPV